MKMYITSSLIVIIRAIIFFPRFPSRPQKLRHQCTTHVLPRILAGILKMQLIPRYLLRV
ncbi:hypothetical protein Hdeb2414_s0010g00333291 [Helianthus debilis subsp. tardiflorus]